MLPKLDGLSLIQQLRAKGTRIPVLILSAKASVDDRVKGLQAGAMITSQSRSRSPSYWPASRPSFAALPKPLNPPGSWWRPDLGFAHAPGRARGREDRAAAPRVRPARIPHAQPNRTVTKTMILEHIFDYSFDPQTKRRGRPGAPPAQQGGQGPGNAAHHPGVGYVLRPA